MHTHMHTRGGLFGLALFHEVGRNGLQVLGYGSWFLECCQGPPTWSGHVCPLLAEGGRT